MQPGRILPAKEIEKRRAAYDAALENQIAHDQPKILQVKQHIDELSKSVENEPEDKDSKCLAHMNALNHWKEKYPHATWLNVAPFTATGDINDAVFNPPPSATYDRSSRFRHAIHDFES
ncbi:unnamed protein product [Rotaria sordida]|nr:unnamed protein product [Rotaria sordida]CAF4029094.1 unnamed protein product [Rotaria sordida]